MYKFMISLSFIAIFILNYGVYAQDVTENYNTTESTVIATEITSTVKPTPNITCEVHNHDCKACVANSQCYYCETTDKCHFHIQRGIVDGQCDITHAFFLTCKANFKIMMIIIGVLSAIPILIILIVCCYCCCKRKKAKVSKDDLKWARQREERKQIAAEKRRERAERTEEIRKKYGLVKDSNPYQRFDA